MTSISRVVAMFAILLAALAEAGEAPNVIVILADDLGYGDVGAYGATRIRTPHIDRLAATGLTFRNGYASANVCTPSRAGLMTGRYAIRSGLAFKVVAARDTKGLPAAEETLGELAKRAGHATLFVGKWHLGGFPEFLPLEHGFDAFFGVPHSNDMPDFALYRDRDRIEEPVDQATLTRRYTEAAVAFIRAQRSAPFLLFVSHTFPHIPLYASDEFRGRSNAGLYGDAVEELDWSVGRILDELDAQGLSDNTIVIFSSDNGPFFEGRTAGLKGGKGTTWEAGYRVPMIVTWPAVTKAGVSSEAIVSNLDVLPTVADALGVAPAAALLDGRSWLPLLRGERQQVHDFLYYFNNERLVGVRSPAWKYVTHAYYTGSLGAFEKFDELPGFTAAYDLLFDAVGEDGEAYSLADRHPEVLAALQAELKRARLEFDALRTRDLEPTYPE